MKTAAPHVLKGQDLARIMRVHPFTVARLAREGRIPGAFRMGGQWRFPTRELLRWMEAGGDMKRDLRNRKRRRR